MAYMLEIPWELRGLTSRYPQLSPRGGGLYVFNDTVLPDSLKEFQTQDFSYARWLADNEELKAGRPPYKTALLSPQFKPHQHQTDGAKEIYKWYFSGQPGGLLADKTGVGKTLTSVVAMTAVAKKRGFTETNKAKLLVVCPKGVIPVWRQTLQSYGGAQKYLRIMVINYQQLGKLLKPSAAMTKKENERKKAAKGKKRRPQSAKSKKLELARHGDPLVNFDFIVFDEGHYLKNYGSSLMSLEAASIARLNRPYVAGSSPFVLYSTATPGSTPLNLAIMAPFLSKCLSKTATNVTPETWGDFLLKQGFAVSKTKTGWSWASVPWFGKDSKDPAERKRYELAAAKAKLVQRKDSQRIGKALTAPSSPFLMRSPKDIAGWPEQQVIPLPLELSPAQKPIYEEAWTRFRSWLKLTPARSDPKGALVETLRYRQKSSLLKVDSLIETVVDWVQTGNQVYISVEFMETLDAYRARLEARGIKVAEISGRTTAVRTEERLKFQKGEAMVVLSTVVEGISLHAGERLPDGTQATTADRISMIHDLRQNPLNTIQAMGRAHRDGQNSVLFIPYFEGTVDQRVVVSFITKDANQKAMTGASQEAVEELENLFRSAAA